MSSTSTTTTTISSSPSPLSTRRHAIFFQENVDGDDPVAKLLAAAPAPTILPPQKTAPPHGSRSLPISSVFASPARDTTNNHPSLVLPTSSLVQRVATSPRAAPLSSPSPSFVPSKNSTRPRILSPDDQVTMEAAFRICCDRLPYDKLQSILQSSLPFSSSTGPHSTPSPPLSSSSPTLSTTTVCSSPPLSPSSPAAVSSMATTVPYAKLFAATLPPPPPPPSTATSDSESHLSSSSTATAEQKVSATKQATATLSISTFPPSVLLASINTATNTVTTVPDATIESSKDEFYFDKLRAIYGECKNLATATDSVKCLILEDLTQARLTGTAKALEQVKQRYDVFLQRYDIFLTIDQFEQHVIASFPIAPSSLPRLEAADDKNNSISSSPTFSSDLVPSKQQSSQQSNLAQSSNKKKRGRPKMTPSSSSSPSLSVAVISSSKTSRKKVNGPVDDMNDEDDSDEEWVASKPSGAYVSSWYRRRSKRIKLGNNELLL